VYVGVLMRASISLSFSVMADVRIT